MSNQSSMTSKHQAPADAIRSIALIGCGAIAREYYLPALSAQPGLLAKLVLVDPDETRGATLRRQFNVKHWVADYHEVIGSVEGAIVSAPTHLHYPLTMELLRNGVHVLCEKPLAESADRAREMVQQAHDSGVVLATNYLQRLYPSFAAVKEMLSTKQLGEPQSIRYEVYEEFDWPTVSGFYFNAPLSCRGVLRDRGAHVLDHVCWWLDGKPSLVQCQNDSFGGSDAVARVVFQHKGCMGEVRLSWLSKAPCRFSVECHGGTIQGDVYDSATLWLTANGSHAKRIALRSSVKTKADVARKIVSNFMAAIAGREGPLVPGSAVLDSIAFIDECYAAASRFPMPWYPSMEANRG